MAVDTGLNIVYPAFQLGVLEHCCRLFLTGIGDVSVWGGGKGAGINFHRTDEKFSCLRQHFNSNPGSQKKM